MSFDSGAYLLFLPAVTVLHWICPPRGRWIVLLGASVLFYMSWNVPMTLLLGAMAGISWLAGRILSRAEDPGLRRGVLILALALCGGLLGYFKYFNFLAQSLAGLLGGTWTPWDILLPVGGSFYTFQALSYVIDIYRRDLPAEGHFGYYALYLAFFPQLVAGPIERAGDLLPQLRKERRLSRTDLSMGLRLLLSGYFRKVVIADFCGAFVTAAFAAAQPDGSAVLGAALLFALQIYNDFAGYSEIAAGSARLLGVRLMRNFDQPYRARSIRDFWRRWHISLGRWLAGYLYAPLGGNRRGLRRQLLATLVVFAASGLWHGANWTFVVWGLLHGSWVVLELLLERAGVPAPRSRSGQLAAQSLTFCWVCFSWLFFRSENLDQALFLLGRLFAPWNPGAGLACLGLGGADLLRLALLLPLDPVLRRLSEEREVSDMTCVYAFLAIAAAWLLRLGQNGANAFLYFQF
ncbi:MAG: MBOAT family protein [Oscillospiraceae bacterium]|nr:MBOAT family protein [Oscillospiraceae bacterium]